MKFRRIPILATDRGRGDEFSAYKVFKRPMPIAKPATLDKNIPINKNAAEGGKTTPCIHVQSNCLLLV
jgi:hypothetical protein